ncbi:MAG: type I polyketide synthase [bacterium]|nr:type I polyketide synthase [bacterium]
MKDQPDNYKNNTDGIAIIGMAGRFPGAGSVSELWKNLCKGRESISFFSHEELRNAGISEKELQDPDYVRASPVLKDIDFFDASFFKYSPKEARALDPQHRLLLECAWEAFEDAGYALDTCSREIGVFAGSGGSISSYLLSYLEQNPDARGKTGSYQHLGNDKDFLPARISYKLNLRGPSIAVQTACSTSLVAVHLACQSILNGECDMALAGAVSVRIPQLSGYMWEKGNVFSRDGHCRAFDADAQGIVFGSGLGIVLLKPLEDALRHRDNIYAVIRGTAVNNDGGEKTSFTATGLKGQLVCMSEAFEVAEIRPEHVTYIEAHGTGTMMGDPVELAALTRCFRASTDKKEFCALGSVKNNVGHLDVSAGMVSLIKAALAIKHGIIPPCINFRNPNPKIDFQNSPFYINTTLEKWQPSDMLRNAGINCLGMGGTNAFAVLSHTPMSEVLQKKQAYKPCYLITFSAKNEWSLKQKLGDMEKWLDKNSFAHIEDISFTVNIGRNHFEKRCAFIVASLSELIETIQDVRKNKKPANYLVDTVKKIQDTDFTFSAETREKLMESIKDFTNIPAQQYREKLLRIGELYTNGYEIDWEKLHKGETGRRISLPSYPFARQRYWISENARP